MHSVAVIVVVVIVVVVVVVVVVASGAVLLFHKCSMSGVYYVNHNHSSSPRPHSYLSCLTSSASPPHTVSICHDWSLVFVSPQSLK